MNAMESIRETASTGCKLQITVNQCPLIQTELRIGVDVRGYEQDW
jgi:hypothetical protein